jgi:hypothetical protein
MLPRAADVKQVKRLLGQFPVVGIIGARQVGKTTLARQIAATRPGQTTFFDLESPADAARLADPLLALQGLRGLVVVDEIQRSPDLFAVLRVLADRRRRPARFLVLGSASPELLRQSAETLAGRIAFHELRGFSLAEVGAESWERLWVRGSFPRSYLSRTSAESARWRGEFIRTFLERDLPQLGFTIPSTTLRRFWSMLAHYHGQVWNASDFARSFGIADTTVRRYLEILASTFMVRILRPFHENVGKRQVKAPKVYVGDSGIVHALLNLETLRDIEAHPKCGASWEGFALEQILALVKPRPEECYFWATHAGAELDLLLVHGRRRLGFEVKRTSAPAMTKSMHMALEALQLTALHVVHAGEHTFPLAPKVTAVPISRLADVLG